MTTIEDYPSINQETPHEQEFEDTEFSYEILRNPYERMHYVHLTDDLIERMDGSNEHYPKPDYVIFLDKSARPVNWMVQSLWDTLAAKDADGNTPERPQSLFVNIDARRRRGESENDMADLRALFTVDEPRPGTETMDQETLLDGKNVLIVDEISVSGDTLSYADKLLRRAYPSANFGTFAWMNGSPKKVGGRETNNPRWYERNSDRYRIVVEDLGEDTDRATELLEQDERVRRGWKWLAKLPRSATPSAARLRTEIRHLSEDIRSGKLPYWPSMQRADEEERIKQFNHIDVADFDSFRHWMKARFWPDVYTAGTITDETGPLSDARAVQEAQRNGTARDFHRFPLTEQAVEFKNQFSFTHASVASTGLAAAKKRR